MISNFIKDLQVKIEKIPGPGAIVYNAIVRRILIKPELSIAKSIVKKINRGIVVDLGCGTGFLSIEIAKRAPQITVIGIDLSPRMVKIASGYGRDYNNVSFRIANAINLPFSNNSIDFITSTGSLHHWKHPIKVFNECYRVLKKNSEAWIYDGCYSAPDNLTVKLRQQYGFFRYKVFSQITKFHGFKWKTYQTRIKSILEHTRFKNNFKMEFFEGWMKILLKKKM